MANKEKPTAQIAIRIQPSLRKKLDEICERKYRNVSGVIKELIVKYVEENEEHKI